MFEEIHKTIAVLNQGKTILYPTDTVWGIGGDATSAKVVDAVYQIKQRPLHKSFIILLPTAKDILLYVANPHPDIINIVSSFQTPTTVVFDNVLGFPANILAPDGSLGIRVVQDPFCKALLKQWKKPLISTSANISGEPTPAIFSEISDAIKNKVDYIVDHRQADTTQHASSRIVKIQADGTLLLIR